MHNFFRSTNTVYQFHGCFYHGCEACFVEPKYNRDEIPPNGWNSFNTRREDTERIENLIIDAGHNLVVMWECAWKKERKTVTLSKKYCYPLEDRYRLTENSIIGGIESGELFGAVEVDIEVPEDLKTKFEEMTPIFKNTVVTEKDIGPYMQKHLKESGQKFPDTRYLIGSMFATKILLITPLAQWYLRHGLRITKVHQFIQFNPVKCFQKFADNVSNDRRAGMLESVLFGYEHQPFYSILTIM